MNNSNSTSIMTTPKSTNNNIYDSSIINAPLKKSKQNNICTNLTPRKLFDE